MNTSTVVEIHHLKKTYREGWIWGKSYQALRGVDLNVRRGEVFGLLGPNGAGKTTLIKILLGILHPTAGSATVLGQPAGSKVARSKIGYLPENVMFPRHHTGIGALYFYARLNNVPEADIRRKCPDLLKLVGLAGRETEPVRKYSKGMRQRLGLAQAMMHDPDIMIMDEPTDGLDPLGRSQIRMVIEELRNRGKTIFLNSHILQEVEMVCDRVAILAKGLLRGVGTTRELTAQFHQAMQVSLELIGDSKRILQEIETLGLKTSSQELSPNTAANGAPAFQVAVDVPNQASVDALIDRLRAAEVSFVSIRPRQLSLEDVFMRVVESASNPENANVLKAGDGV